MTPMCTDIARFQVPATEGAQSQKGNVLIEFALILPLFLLLLFGVVTFSVALYDKTMLTMATREGARAGAMYVATSAADMTATNTAAATAAKGKTEALLNNNIKLISFASGSVTPTVTASVDTGTKNINVKASISFTGLYVLPDAMQIAAESTMRTEYQ
ncbi:MAG: pilus assembly protein [Chlorobiaceae bacterium]|nr:pilus assembly protein [Chlorobiaceae bacterium]